MPRHNKKQKKASSQPPPETLDRFAGSSEEEDEVDDHESVDVDSDAEIPSIRVDYAADAEETDESDEGSSDDHEEGRARVNDRKKRKHEPEETAAREQSTGVEEEEDDDSDAEQGATSGMAGAMARILGTKPAKTPTVVLSKTKTPLQKQAEQEKQREKELTEKKSVNRERNLAALHIPLSVATSALDINVSSHLQKELQQERAHRRIATRGVVALFNAISQHQHGPGASEEGKSSAANSSSKDVAGSKMTKTSFLDLIKNKAKAAAGVTKETSKSAPDSADKKQWNAFKDDYLMDAKNPDWEQDDSSLEAGDVDDVSDDEEDATPLKRH